MIERFGIEAMARDLLRGRASSDLSTVIRAVMAERDAERLRERWNDAVQRAGAWERKDEA